MLMLWSTKGKGRVELQLLDMEMLVVCVCVCVWVSQWHKWVGERAKCQRHQGRAPVDPPWWHFDHFMHGFPPRCPHKCATRWMSESKMPRTERKDWKCWRQEKVSGEQRTKESLDFCLGFALRVHGGVNRGESGQEGAEVGPAGGHAWPSVHLIPPLNYFWHFKHGPKQSLAWNDDA
jgi:hypothetical protein